MLYFNTHFMTTKHLLYDWGNNNFIKYNIMGLYAVLMHRHMQITCISIFMRDFNGKLINKSLGSAQTDNISSLYPFIWAANEFFFPSCQF